MKFSEYLHLVEVVVSDIEKEFESSERYKNKGLQNVAL